MSKKVLVLLVYMFFVGFESIFAQGSTISGNVADNQGVPLPGINILEKGTTNGAQTDFDGNFSIKLSGQDAVLIFSYIGFVTQEISIGDKTVLNLVMETDTQQLDEVVVTALGIERDKKALSYSIQEVQTEEIVRASNGNINTALQGKIAGVNVTTTGGVGGNARLELRGPSSLTGNDQVLWVIDGVPFSQNNTQDPENLFSGVSNGGGLLDINPDDIASISVLKGGQAAALYGTRGANGVVLITTKSGKNSKGLGISYTGSTTISEAAYLLDLQDEFGQGSEGVYSPNSRASWGPRLDGSVRPGWTGEDLPYAGGNDLIEDFVQNAINHRHSISVTKSNEESNFKASVLSDKNEGIYKRSQIEKLNFDLRANHDINPWLNIDTKLSYFLTQGNQRPDVGFYSFISQLYSTPTNIRTQELAPGFILENNVPREILFGPSSDLTNNIDPDNRNPYFVQEQQVNSDERNRMFGYLAGNIKFSENLNLKLKYGLDFYRYQQIDGFRFEDNVDKPNRPNYNTGEQFFKEENIEFLLNYNNNITEDFSLSVSAGGNLMKNEFNFLRALSGKIPVTDSFFLNAGSPTASEAFSRREIQSLYGFMDLAYKEYLFLSVTSRNDWSSALASRFTTNKVSFFYPSVGLSALVSEMIDMPEWMNYLKVRGSWAQLGKDTAPFQTNQTFEFLPNLTTFGLPGTEAPDFIVNSNLKPEISTTSEIGLELRLFKNRFKLDATVYDERTVNQIVRVPSLGETSGVSFLLTNAGEISNRGIELIASVVPIKTKDFDLGLTFNFAKNNSVLEELTTPEDDDEIFFYFNSNTISPQVRAIEGEKQGDIFGFGYQRNNNGEIIVGADGLPLRTEDRVKLGNIQADFTGSIGLDTKYKAFSLSALFGMQQGGDIYSLTERRATRTGNSLKSTSLGREPFFVDGRQADGSPNLTIVSPQAYWRSVGAVIDGIDEEFIYDASFLKLTELSISYDMPSKVLKQIGNGVIQGLRLSLIGRNLFYLYRNTPGTVPDAGVFNSSFGAQAFDFSPVPVTRSFGMALNLNF